jgi:glycosyltransferase involved in cell wall biosynthesis
MKAIFYCSNPFFLMHGGTQTLLEALMREIRACGVEVEPARWWDDTQKGDIIHFMNRPTRTLVLAAKQKNFATVMTETMDQTGSRNRLELWLRKFAFQCDRALGSPVTRRLNVEVYRLLDAMVYIVGLERQVANYLYHAPLELTHVIPHGLEASAIAELAQPEPEGDYLLCAATITPRKNTLLLAEAARQANVPVVFLGKPFNDGDPYYLRFKTLVDGRTIQYPGFVSPEEKHRLFRRARGFALLSQFESGSIALYEAAAAGLPLLLPVLPWATRVYQHARDKQFVRLRTPERLAADLRRFYDHAHRQPGHTFPVMTWRQVARQYVDIYENVLRHMHPSSAPTPATV